ncbi:MAG TPA: winged helix-turn-helix domain-containing protein [Pyrinomonadaceae bacterium]|nr:winged helix-turn-helix domain-containing protein [Pyrinomonadaceae bacterium]
MRPKLTHYYEFGPFRLNATERLLQVSTETVALTPKVFDTLLVLVENSGHVLAKNELMERLWPDSYVEESSLTQNISLLRRALGEGEGEHRYIETIPKRGYRFVAEVRELQDPIEQVILHERTTTEITIEAQQIENELPVVEAKEVVSSASSIGNKKWLLYSCSAVVLAGVLAAVMFFANRHPASAAPKSIAILPFKSIGADQGEAELQGLGMADALINRLSKLERTIVLPTSSISRYTARDKDVLSIGKQLGVDAVLDGTVQRDGQRVRVTAQLIRLSDGKSIWSSKLDENYKDTFALQDAASSQLAVALANEVSLDFKDRRVKTTDNPDASREYVTGIFFWNKRGKENLTKAIEHLNEAVQKDPQFALAHAALADCYYLDVDANLGILAPDASLARAYSESEMALTLDDGVAEAHTVRAGLRLRSGDRKGAEASFRRAIELNPNYAPAHFRYGYLLFGNRDVDGSLAEMKRAQQLDPVSPITNNALGAALFMKGDCDGAISSYKRALEVQPAFSYAHLNLIDAYVAKGMFDRALAEAEYFRANEPYLADTNKAYVYAASGRHDEAKRLWAQVTKGKETYMGWESVQFFAVMGDYDKAFEWLNKTQLNRSFQSGLRFDPRLEGLRNDPRFAEYLKGHP